MITTALRRNGPLEFMVSTTTGERGEVKGLKKQAEVGVGSLTLTIANIAWDGARKLACSLRSGTVLSRKVVGKTAHSPCQSDSPVRPQRKQRLTQRDKNANRQVKQAAEGSQEG